MIADKQLSSFVTTNTKSFFTILGLPDSFLSNDPDTWSADENYKSAEKIVKSITVVSDAAERKVKLIGLQDFNTIWRKMKSRNSSCSKWSKNIANCTQTPRKAWSLPGYISQLTIQKTILHHQKMLTVTNWLTDFACNSNLKLMQWCNVVVLMCYDNWLHEFRSVILCRENDFYSWWLPTLHFIGS